MCGMRPRLLLPLTAAVLMLLLAGPAAAGGEAKPGPRDKCPVCGAPASRFERVD